MNDFSMKELYDVSLKATTEIEIGSRKIEPGEIITVFDKVLLSTFSEEKDVRTAHGGYGDRARIYWETSKDIRFALTQGVFSKTQWALMMNSKIISDNGPETFMVSVRESIETDENGVAATAHEMNDPIFVYDAETGERIIPIETAPTTIMVDGSYRSLIVDYQYNYNNGFTSFVFGRNLMGIYFSLEGKTRVKDDVTGQVTTGIIKIPKLRLLSNLSMRLGQNAAPVAPTINAVALPVGERGHETIMEIDILNDDIDSDL